MTGKKRKTSKRPPARDSSRIVRRLYQSAITPAHSPTNNWAASPLPRSGLDERPSPSGPIPKWGVRSAPSTEKMHGRSAQTTGIESFGTPGPGRFESLEVEASPLSGAPGWPPGSGSPLAKPRQVFFVLPQPSLYPRFLILIFRPANGDPACPEQSRRAKPSRHT